MDALSNLDAAFLQAEDADEHVSMAISSLAVFEGSPPSHDELVRALSARLSGVPRYWQRLHRFPLDLVAPVWVNDPDFDINFHVRRTALAAPGGEAELERLMARVMSQRLDVDRPLWETWVVEGLADGRWALLSKVHHCLVDGVGGTELYHLLLSTSPDPDPTEQDAEWFTPPFGESDLRIYVDAAWRATSKPFRLLATMSAAARHPRRAAARAVTTADGLRSLAHAFSPIPPTTLLGPIGRQRRYTATTVPLSDIKEIRHRFDVTVNDVALAAISAGFRRMLLARGEDPASTTLRSLVPTNVRVPGTEGELANRVSCMFVDLPVHLDEPAERVRAVHDLLVAAKTHHEAEAGETLLEMGAFQPFAAVSAAVRASLRAPQHSVATVTTNVPGPRIPLYLLGRKMVRLMPFVPIADRVRVGVAMLSYCDEMSFGITGDYDSAADVTLLAQTIEAEIRSLSRSTGFVWLEQPG